MLNTHDAALGTSLQNKSADKNRADGLRSPGVLGRWPIIGLVMFLLGGMLFGVMAINLETNGPFIQTDVQVVNTLHVTALQSPPILRDVMILGFYVGEHVVIAIGAGLLLYFLYKRYWLELSMVVIAWAGEAAMWLILSAAFNRARPVFAVSAWRQMTGPGFPSGHCIGAVMCYGLLAYLLVPKISSRFWKIVVIVVALLIMLYIGFSRMFVGDHYLTDVLAGYGLGILWTGLVYTSAEWVAQRRKKHQAV
ncbi:MAG: phosphatase PAP2 family protein [Aggregatilineales bacterium]